MFCRKRGKNNHIQLLLFWSTVLHAWSKKERARSSLPQHSSWAPAHLVYLQPCRRRIQPAATCAGMYAAPVVTKYVEFGRTDELSRLSVPERHRLSLCIALVLASACCAVVGPLWSCRNLGAKGAIAPEEFFRTCNVLPVSCTHLAR